MPYVARPGAKATAPRIAPRRPGRGAAVCRPGPAPGSLPRSLARSDGARPAVRERACGLAAVTVLVGVTDQACAERPAVQQLLPLSPLSRRSWRRGRRRRRRNQRAPRPPPLRLAALRLAACVLASTALLRASSSPRHIQQQRQSESQSGPRVSPVHRPRGPACGASTGCRPPAGRPAAFPKFRSAPRLAGPWLTRPRPSGRGPARSRLRVRERRRRRRRALCRLRAGPRRLCALPSISTCQWFRARRVVSCRTPSASNGTGAHRRSQHRRSAPRASAASADSEGAVCSAQAVGACRRMPSLTPSGRLAALSNHRDTIGRLRALTLPPGVGARRRMHRGPASSNTNEHLYTIGRPGARRAFGFGVSAATARRRHLSCLPTVTQNAAPLQQRCGILGNVTQPSRQTKTGGCGPLPVHARAPRYVRPGLAEAGGVVGPLRPPRKSSASFQLLLVSISFHGPGRRNRERERKARVCRLL